MATGGKAIGNMVMHMSVDDSQVIPTINNMKKELRDLNTTWKSNVEVAKNAGDAQEASKAKVDGLASAVNKQKEILNSMASVMKNTGERTAENATQYDKLSAQMSKAQSTLSNYESQLKNATEQYKYQESGLASLNKELKNSNELTKARVDRLQAEGKQEEATKVQVEGLTNAQKLQNDILKKQQDNLKDVAESQGKSSEAYKNQQLRVEKVGTELAKTTNKIKELNGHSISPKMGKLKTASDKLKNFQEQIHKTNSMFGSMFMANMATSVATRAISSVTGKIRELTHQAQEYNKEQQVMQATWHTLTGEVSKADDMVQSINKMATAFGHTNEVVNELDQQFYHVFNNKEKTEALTKDVLTMGDALGMSGKDIERFGLNFTHMMSSTLLQVGDFNHISDQMPMFGEKLLEYEKHNKAFQESIQGTVKVSKESLKQAKLEANEAFKNTVKGTEVNKEQLSKLIDAGVVGGQQMTKLSEMVEKNGKVSSGTVKQMIASYQEAVAKSAAANDGAVDASELNMKQLRDAMSSGKVSAEDAVAVMHELGDQYKDASENMMKTLSGMERSIGARGKALMGALIAPIMNTQNPLFEAVSKWVSDDKTAKEFDKVGQSISKAFGTITEAFGKSFKSDDIAKGMDKFMDNLAMNIEKLGDNIAKHKDDIISFFHGAKALTGVGLTSFGLALKLAIPLLETLGNFAEHHPTAFKVLAGSLLGVSFGLKAVSASAGGIGFVLDQMNNLAKAKSWLGGKKGFKWVAKLNTKNFKKSFKGLGSLVKKGSKGIWKGVTATAKLVTKGFMKSLGLIKTGLGKSAKGIATGVSWTAKLASKAFMGSVKGLWKFLKSPDKYIKNAFKYTAKLISKGFKNAVNGLKKFTKSSGKGIGKALKKTAKLAWKGFKKTLSTIVSTTKVAGKKISKALKQTPKLLWKGFKKTLTVMWTTAKITGKKIGRALKQTPKIALSGFKKAMGTMLSIGKKTGKGLKAAFNFAKANPIFMILAIGTAIYELYQHCKPFRDFINGLAKIVIGFFKGVVDFLKNNWKEVLTFILNPFAGIARLLYKHVKPFRDIIDGLLKWIKNVWGAVPKFFSNVWKGITNIFSNAWKGIINIIKWYINTTINFYKNLFKNITKIFSNIFKSVSDIFSKMWKWIVDFVKNYINWCLNLYKDLWHGITNIFDSIWKSVSKIFSGMWDWIVKAVKDSVKNVLGFFNGLWTGICDIFNNLWKSTKDIFGGIFKWLGDFVKDKLDAVTNTFSKAWDSVKDGFNKMWDGMKSLASDGINLVINPINSGIGLINGLIHNFGGGKETIKPLDKVHLATGTGALNDGQRRAIKKPTMAVLNDGNDSHETGNKEMVIMPNGDAGIVQGRNTEMLLPAGAEVLNARETAMLMNQMNVKHFAEGTGWWSSLKEGASDLYNGGKDLASGAWDATKKGASDVYDGAKGVAKWTSDKVVDGYDWVADKAGKIKDMIEFIGKAVAHPIDTLKDFFNPKNEGKGDIMHSLADGFIKKPVKQVQDWWGQVWKMADGNANGSNAQGDDYDFKSHAKDDGADPWGYYYRECVSFVANRLKHMGVDESLFSHLGNGSDWVNSKARHTNTPEPGMVAVYGGGSPFSSNHVAMVSDVKGDTISGEEYNFGENGQYNKYSGRSIKDVTTFLDFGKRMTGSGDKKESGGLTGFIEKQLGGMMKWIKKFISPKSSASSGTSGDVQSWSNDVKKALKANGLSDSSDMVQKVLKQIQTESGGNPKAIQNGYTDINSGGNEARGLMQVIPTTFDAYKHAGHNDPLNGYDSLLAGLAYAKSRYGDNLSVLGNGIGYANGGFINHEHQATVGEGNQPEVVIPLDSMKKSRGFELLGQTVTAMASRDGLDKQLPQTQNDNTKLESKLDSVIGLLGQLVQQGVSVVTPNVVLDRNQLYQQQANDSSLRQFQAL